MAELVRVVEASHVAYSVEAHGDAFGYAREVCASVPDEDEPAPDALGDGIMLRHEGQW